MYRFIRATHVLLNSSLDMSVYLINEYICMKDDFLLGKLKENCLLFKLYGKTQKNVSETRSGIEPATV